MIFGRKISKIREKLKSQNQDERFAVVKDLEGKRGKEVVELLGEALNDPSPVVRRRAANALLETWSRDAIPPLIRALNDKDKKVRWMAAYALGRLGEEGYDEAFDIIAKALDDEDWNVRRIIALQLRHSDPKVLDPLLKAIKDENPFVRRYAAFGLGRMHNVDAVKQLVGALKDDVKEVRDYAGWALDLIAKKNNIPSREELIKLYG
ncbi:MAG: HEAT repeat domain-containing protein [Candidatus Hydrothermarchaeales archaeon]